MDLSIHQLRDKAADLAAQGTRYGLTAEERKDLALLEVIIRKYDSMGAKS